MSINNLNFKRTRFTQLNSSLKKPTNNSNNSANTSNNNQSAHTNIIPTVIIEPPSSSSPNYVDSNSDVADLSSPEEHSADDSSNVNLTTTNNNSTFSNSNSQNNQRKLSSFKVSRLGNSFSSSLTQHLMPDHHDHDRISLGSINMVFDDLNKPRKESSQTTANQRRSSIMRRNWAQHSDVPFIIGANVTEENNGTCGKILLALSWFLMVVFFPLSLFVTLKVVQEYERAVIFRLGRLVKGGARGPGLFIVLPCIESYTKVDMRTVSFDVPPQEVLTKDSVTVAVDAVVYYRVFNPVISIANVENAQESTRLLAQTSLRNVLGTNSLAEILSNREAVSLCMREILDEATDQWGIKVERVEIKDVRLPIQLQRAMAAEAEATREARAKVIAAEGEHKASRALKDAANVLSESSSALQLRYLQTLNNIAAEKNSTIVFPLPIEFLSNFMSYTSAKTELLNNTLKLNYKNNSCLNEPVQLSAYNQIQSISDANAIVTMTNSKNNENTSSNNFYNNNNSNTNNRTSKVLSKQAVEFTEL